MEHTVTEEITGVDLVRAQLASPAAPRSPNSRLTQPDIPAPRGAAIQLRINMETMDADGETRPAAGTLTAYEPPTGPGLRVDGYGYVGYATNPRFDTLLAKLIVRARTPEDAAADAYRALCEFRIEGVATNIGLLQALLCHADVAADRVHTRFVEDNIAALVDAAMPAHRRLFFDGGGAADAAPSEAQAAPPGAEAHPSRRWTGVLLALQVAPGETVALGQTVAVIEAMKMQHDGPRRGRRHRARPGRRPGRAGPPRASRCCSSSRARSRPWPRPSRSRSRP